MPVIETFRIENDAEADEYLQAMLANPEFRSMSEIEIRGYKLIPDPQVRNRFFEKGKADLERRSRPKS
jgi:hypothetical protein